MAKKEKKITKSMLIKEEFYKGTISEDIATLLNVPLPYVHARVGQFVQTDLNRYRGRLPHLEKDGLLTESMYRGKLIRDQFVLGMLKEYYDKKELKRQKKIERARRYQEKISKKDTSANKPSN